MEKVLKVHVHQIYKDVWPGCINNGTVYEAEDKRVFFVKDNKKLGVIFTNILNELAYMNYRK